MDPLRAHVNEDLPSVEPSCVRRCWWALGIMAVIGATAVACQAGSGIPGNTPTLTKSPTPSLSASPTPSSSPEANTVDGSASTFDLNLLFSGAIQGNMTRAHSSAGLCDASASRINVILD